MKTNHGKHKSVEVGSEVWNNCIAQIAMLWRFMTGKYQDQSGTSRPIPGFRIKPDLKTEMEQFIELLKTAEGQAKAALMCEQLAATLERLLKLYITGHLKYFESQVDYSTSVEAYVNGEILKALSLPEKYESDRRLSDQTNERLKAMHDEHVALAKITDWHEAVKTDGANFSIRSHGDTIRQMTAEVCKNKLTEEKLLKAIEVMEVTETAQLKLVEIQIEKGANLARKKIQKAYKSTPPAEENATTVEATTEEANIPTFDAQAAAMFA